MKRSVSLSALRTFIAVAAILTIVPACRQDTAAPQAAHREVAAVALEASLAPGEATIGDKVTYTVSLSRTQDITASLPELKAAPGGLTLIDAGSSGPRTEAGRIVEKKWAAYRVDSVGTIVFPSLTIQYQQNGANREAASQTISLQVKSVLPQNMTDIHDLKPLELPKRTLWPFIAVAALLVLSAVAAWFLWKRRRKPEALQLVLPPHLEAEQRLRELEAMGLLARGDFKRYYFLLSEIFRRYLEQRFAFPAVERTTEEILAKLDALRATEAHKDEVRDFLRNTEPVKFAGAGCSSPEALAETDRVRRFVAETRQQTPDTTEERTHVAV